MSYSLRAADEGPAADGDLTREQALARIAELETKLNHDREAGQTLAEFFLNDILNATTPNEVVRMVGRLLQRFLAERGNAPGHGDVWVTVKRNRFGIGPGDLLGRSDPSAKAAGWEHFASAMAPVTVTSSDDRAYVILPLFAGVGATDVFGLIGIELLADETLLPDASAVALSTAVSVTLQLERTSRVAQSLRSTQYAQAAARAQILLAGPHEYDEALRIVVETLGRCEDVSGVAAVITADSPRMIAAWGDVDEKRAIELAVAGQPGELASRGFYVVPIRIDDAVEGAIVLRARSHLKALEYETLAMIAGAVAGAVARHRAGLTIDSLRRSATRRLVEAQERERSVVAANIHDGVLQQLGATAIRLELAQARVEHGDFATARAIIEDGANEIRSCARELRALLMELRPQVLDDIGLSAALKELGQHIKDVDIRVTTNVPDDLGNEYSITIFRIVQEALTNIEKHAHARHAEVSVTLEQRSIDIEVRDDGIGYEAAVTGPSAEGSHLGLLGMRERARMLGGRFSIEGGPGRGTLIRAILPLTPRTLRDADRPAADDDASPEV
jgi:signal transduction histidine kinase